LGLESTGFAVLGGTVQHFWFRGQGVWSSEFGVLIYRRPRDATCSSRVEGLGVRVLRVWSPQGLGSSGFRVPKAEGLVFGPLRVWSVAKASRRDV